MLRIEEYVNISYIPISYCIAILESGNATIRSYKVRLAGFAYENSRNKPEQQFMAFVYTCVILGYFSFFIMLLMVKGLWEDKKNQDCKIAEILENIEKANDVEVKVREKRKLQMAKEKALGYAGKWNNKSRRRSSTQSCIPTIVVIEASPPMNTRISFSSERERCSESTTDEESVCSSNGSIISFAT